MALKRMVLQIGMGTDIRGRDSTKAAVRAVEDALRHNALTIARALGLGPEAMHVEVTVGVPRPETVDAAAVLAALPYGRGTARAVAGGLEIADESGGDATLIAHAAVVVRLDVP